MYEEIMNETRRLEQRAQAEGYQSKYEQYLEEYRNKFYATKMTELEKHILIFLKFLNDHKFFDMLKEEGDVYAGIAYVTVRNILQIYTRDL